jgi:formate hydrogenlyase transcriptional activator
MSNQPPLPNPGLHDQQMRYRLLVRLAHLINSSLDIREVFQRIAVEIHQLTGAERISLCCREEGDGQPSIMALELVPNEAWIEMPQSLVDTAAGWVLQNRRTRINRRLDQAPLFADERWLFSQGYRACVYLPLICRNQSLAVLGLAARAEKSVDGWDLSFLRDLGNLLATAVDNTAAYRQIAQLKTRLEDENVRLREEIHTRQGNVELIGTSPAMQEVRRAIAQVAATDSTVLILGESGTGKEVLARAIHEQSNRREQLLVKVNCAALAPGLLTSELFGHESGAFTGATRRRLGRFELAHQGSIFLDEIGEVSPEVQVMLLRVLQERALERVGGNETVPIDVRVLAATNRDLGQAITDNRFRLDLYYRLNVFPIRLPPLRERPEDIGPLLDHFIAQFDRRMNKPIAGVSQRTLDLARNYAWPGNVRELENLVERAMIVCSGPSLEIDPSWLAAPSAAQNGPVPARRPSLAQQERQSIVDALARCHGKIYGPDGAAELLGLKPTTLYGKMRKHQIRKKTGATHIG